ncbi:hypothetical protein CC80DRAFT_486653 [Byssothecium circinans]|uniref:Asl1-like glycosyl hydrolase catalytic domain-containing protein n=1 Tax=Byssothecium circinans TaxID=147558 RepID=A0A6A5UQA5_9PLEO|nr:hypothetical protein CC80DRAFT_486653 [Byssothecium circinans]
MSPNMKISLLALVGSAAAAAPHYNAHSRFHSSGGFVGPTGGWASQNATRPAAATGTATVSGNRKTTSVEETTYSTTTVVSTIYMNKPSSAPVNVADVSTPSADACGPPTVYVTATEKVTVTVPAGGASSTPGSSSSSSAVVQVPSSAQPASSGPKYSAIPSAPSAPPAASPSKSAIKEEQPTTSKVASVPASTPKASAPATSAAPVPSSSAAPSKVVVPSSSAAVPSSSSASAKPSSPSAPSYSGGKRGLAYRWDAAADCKSFASKMKAGFAWNWESDSRGDIGGIPFIPTLRTLANAGDWSTKVDAAIKAGSKVVFGFNEVDKADQANLGVAAACTAWKTHMNPIAAKHPDVQIVGPSVSSDVAKGTGLDWLSQFKTQCPEAIYHAANIHWYGYGTANFDDFKAHVESAIKQFGKVWVTEFALVNRSVAESQAFLEKALAYLDSNANCQGYSYFAVGQFDSAYNMLGTGNALSDVGKVYVS